MRPTQASLQIATEGGQTVTLALNPLWAAKLVRTIKQGPSRITLDGCLPEGSPAASPERQHWQIFPQAVTLADVEGWE